MKKKKKLFFVFVLIILGLLFIPIFHHQNLFTKVKNSISSKIYYDHLSELRQEAYDKMKIEYVNVKNRVTGTAPFNSGSVSNANGMDVSDSDDYIRTFDVMKYTVEVGISPNKAAEGVTDESVYEGGVIKVRAKLPNQETPILMTWDQDAWMQNVSYSEDHTEIYAEYHVPEGVSITNANQNLTFTIKTSGYKKEVSNEMKPEFTIWMEGNKEDNPSSSAESITTKDTRNIIISGKPNYNLKLKRDHYNYYSKQNDVDGHVIMAGVMLGLVQSDSSIPDLRGIEYPIGDFTIEADMSFYSKPVGESDFTVITGDTPNSLGPVNGTDLFVYGINGRSSNRLLPSNDVMVSTLPYGYATSNRNKSIYDSGNIQIDQSGNKLVITFSNYSFDGKFPTMHNDGSTVQYSSREGNFAAGFMEFFVPYYDDGVHDDMDYQFGIDAKKMKFSTPTQSNISVGDTTFSDAISSDNSIKFSLVKRDGNMYAPININTSPSIARYLSTNYYAGDGSAMLGSKFYIQTYTRMDGGPYEGGTVSYFSWNTNYYKYTPENGKYYYTDQRGSYGFNINHNLDRLKIKYGLFKADIQNGITQDIDVNRSKDDAFDWYDSYEEASAIGKVTAIYEDNPDNIGFYSIDYVFYPFTVVDDSTNVGKRSFFRRRFIAYGDEERTDAYINNSAVFNAVEGFTPTNYGESGEILSYQSPYEHGETLLITGVNASNSLTVTDKDSSNKPKKAYDVQEGEIHFKITPKLSNGMESSSTDKVVDHVFVTVTLPEGLAYKTDSANKTLESITVNGDGTTTMVWEYQNWQVNRSAPDYSTILFTAEISSSVENNSSLTVKSVISTEEDKRDAETYRTSNYGVVISNLSGSKVYKEIDKGFVEKEESFHVISTVGNNGEETLLHMKTIEILPYNHDQNGSHFSGNYTSKFISKLDNQKLFYTTGQITNIGLTEDIYGKLTVKDVDLEHDSRWVEVQIGETIPNNATAVATLISSIEPKTEGQFIMEVTPSNNKELDQYAFVFNMTSDNLIAALKTNTVVTKVVDRRISGKAFFDQNRSGNYDQSDDLLESIVVHLLDENGTEISTTITDDQGEYLFTALEKRNYYVSFDIPRNYEVIPKGEGSKANSNGKTDLISSLNVEPTTQIMEVNHIDMGIRKIEAKINVKYVNEDYPDVVIDSKKITKYFGDSYNTDQDSIPNIPIDYELVRKTDNYAGTVEEEEIEVIYYYRKKDPKVNVELTKTGTEEITSLDDPIQYTLHYHVGTNDYLGSLIINMTDYLPYQYTNQSIVDGGRTSPGGGLPSSRPSLSWGDDLSFFDYGSGIISLIPDTGREPPSEELTKHLTLYYDGVDPTKDFIINKVNLYVKLDYGYKETFERTFETRINIKGKITTRYIEVDENGEEIKSIIDDETTEEKVGKPFPLDVKEFEGYELVKTPFLRPYEYELNERVLVFAYQKKNVKVETITHGIGGKIQGDETVSYGEDSTKDHIVIEAEDGYQIESILINGEEIELKGVETKKVLENFKKMKEDKIVEVTFKKLYMEIEVPNTALSKSRLLTIIGLLCILGSIGVNYYAFHQFKKQ